MANFIDLKGKKFLRWTVLEYVGKINNTGNSKWKCKCICGTIRNVDGHCLRKGRSESCGCYHYETLKNNKTKHGCTDRENGNTVEYNAWTSLKRRCYNKNCKNYPTYGGRGITVCERWLGEYGFSNFLLDMGKRPSKRHSLDRYPDNDYGIYEPNNCRWATQKQQCRNKRNNVWIEYKGKKMILEDWVKRFKCSNKNIRQFLNKHTFEEAYDYYINNKHTKRLPPRTYC